MNIKECPEMVLISVFNVRADSILLVRELIQTQETPLEIWALRLLLSYLVSNWESAYEQLYSWYSL